MKKPSIAFRVVNPVLLVARVPTLDFFKHVAYTDGTHPADAVDIFGINSEVLEALTDGDTYIVSTTFRIHYYVYGSWSWVAYCCQFPKGIAESITVALRHDVDNTTRAKIVSEIEQRGLERHY